MHYYKYIDANGNITQYEATTRAIHANNVVEITLTEYEAAIAEIEKANPITEESDE